MRAVRLRSLKRGFIAERVLKWFVFMVYSQLRPFPGKQVRVIASVGSIDKFIENMRSKSQRALRGIKKKDPRIYRPATDEADAATKVAECEGNTAKLNLLLSRAAYRDDLLTARAALEAGADPNSQNLLGEGPILSLCFKGGVEMLHLLLKYRASLGPDKFGVQALYHCVNHERLELISPMVRAGADVNAYENQLLQTPLHRAVFCTEGPKFVKLLLNLGADPRPVDAAGHTPLDLAELSQKRFGGNKAQ